MRFASPLSCISLLLAFGIGLPISGCTPDIVHRGYIAKPNAFEQLRDGMTKAEVEGVLGSPTTTASVNLQGDSYYYISSVTKQVSFLTPQELDRKVVAVRFDRSERVSGFAQYGLQEGKIINLNTRKTVVTGSEFSILSELFNGVGTGVAPDLSPIRNTR